MDKIKKEVRKVLADYIAKNGLRNTRERYDILDEIYNGEGHFEIDELFSNLRQKKVNVSRGTVYNSIDTLIQSGLIVKHQFGHKKIFYEKSYNYKQHEHLICDNCEHIFEFYNPNLKPITDMAADILKFKVKSQSLVISGECESFCKTGKCAHGNVPKEK